MFYSVYLKSTGALLSSGSSLGETVPGNPDLGWLTRSDPIDQRFNVWDPTLVDGVPVGWVPRAAPAPRTTISKRAFMGRIPIEHLIALNMLRRDPTAPAQLRATLDTAAELRDMVTEINLLDAATQQFVPVATDALIGLGLVAAGDRAAYIAAWLAPEPAA